MVLDIGKHTFNYPWPHISLKYLHCTTPQGNAVHDLSSNLFMCHLLRHRLIAFVSEKCMGFVVDLSVSLAGTLQTGREIRASLSFLVAERGDGSGSR